MGQWILLSFDPAPVCFYEGPLRRKPITHRHRKTKTSEIPEPRPLSRVSCAGAYYPIFILYRGVREAPIPSVWSMLIDVVWYPLYEEVSYRGFFLGFLAKEGGDFSRHNLGLNLLQSLLFVLVHRHHVSAGFPFRLIPVLLLGFLNGLVFLRSRNVTGCIVGHAIVNGTAWLMQTWIS